METNHFKIFFGKFSYKGIFAILLVALVSSLILTPFGKFDSRENWKLDSLSTLSDSQGKRVDPGLNQVKARKIEVVTQYGGDDKNTKKIFRVSLTHQQAILNGTVINLLDDKGAVLVSEDGYNFKKPLNKVNQLNFQDDILSHPPKVEALKTSKILSDFLPKHLDVSDTRALSYSSNMREIEFYAVFPEDFAGEKPEEELIQELLRVTFNANKYLRDLNFMLVPVGAKVYRNSSRFTSSLALRDPYAMLAAGVDEKAAVSTPNHDLLVVFSRAYFQRASGLAFMSTACQNPTYSVLFASGGPASQFFELSLSATFAHEVGHFLGMAHDDQLYGMGFSLMASHQTAMPFGFSSLSVGEQLNYSADGQAGGQCFSLVDGGGDLDKDGHSNEEEEFLGTDPLDAGSYYESQSGKSYLTYNTFNSQGVITEIGGSEAGTTDVQFKIFDLNGQKLEANSLQLNGFSEFDLIVSKIPSVTQNTYGVIELDSNLPIHSRSSIYSFETNFEKFKYVLQHNLFKPVKTKKIFLPYNSIVPGTMPKGSKVVNWLSLVNTSNTEQQFRVRTFSPFGILSEERLINVPAMGRRDVRGDSEKVTEGMGTNEVEIFNNSNNVGLNAFLNRYYLDQNGSLVSATQIDGVAPSGVTKHFVHNSTQSAKTLGIVPVDAWIEVVNSSLTSNTFKIKAETVNGEILLQKSFELAPLSQMHLQLPSFGRNYLISIDSLKVEGLTIQGFKYVNEFGLMSVESLKFLEEIKKDKFGSINNFINTSNSLILSNSQKKKGLLNCKLYSDWETIDVTQELTSELLEILNISELFPSMKKDSYATIGCSMKEFNGAPIPNSMRIDRLVEGRLMVEQVMQ